MRAATRVAAVLAVLAGVAAAMAPVGTATAAVSRNHPHGFFVVDRNGTSQKVEDYGTESALVRDAQGREHLVTTDPSPTDPAMGNVVYLTRQTDASPWVTHVVPGLIPLSGGAQVEAHLSYDGQRIFAVIFGCDAIYVTDAPTAARRLPVPSQVKPLGECADPPEHSDNPPVAQAGALYGREISILTHDDVAGKTVYSIDSGLPGGTFTSGTPLPTADDFIPEQIAADPQYGRLVVVGTGTNGLTEGIYETYQDRYTTTWSDPVLVASLDSNTTDYKIDSVQTYSRHTYIGLEKPSNGVQLAHSLYIVRGQPSGQWLGAVPLPHTTGDDSNLRLVVNTDTRNLHAVWTRITPSGSSRTSGLMHEAEVDNGWLKPFFLTHWYGDVATQITLTANRHPIVGYDQ